MKMTIEMIPMKKTTYISSLLVAIAFSFSFSAALPAQMHSENSESTFGFIGDLVKFSAVSATQQDEAEKKKKEEEFVDKGYLKEHSIGALKIMHKVLGDIIDDHHTTDEKTADQAKLNDPTKNVISITKLMTKKEK